MRRRNLLAFFSFGTAVCCLMNGYRLYALLFSEWLYNRDFSQFYLMGAALRSGVYIYEPTPALAERFNPALGHFLTHPSAYPPVVAVLGLPLSLLPYFWSVVLFTFWELGCLIAALVLVFRHFGGIKAPLPVLLTILCFLTWQPIFVDLYRGQIMLTILLLLTLAWLALRSGHDVRGGILLGVVLSIKLYAWPVMLFLVITRRLKPVGLAVCVFILSNLIMALALSPQAVANYYLSVMPEVGAVWRQDVYNFSLFSLGYRLYGPTGAALLLTVGLGLSLWAALRARDFDHSFMVMLAASTVLAPISWIHYLVTLFPALCLAASRRTFSVSQIAFSIAVMLVLMVGYLPLLRFAVWGALPLVGVLGLVWLIRWPVVQDRQTDHITLLEAT